MSILLVPNHTKKLTERILQETGKILIEQNIDFTVDASEGKKIPKNLSYELVISIGGDGTFLRSAKAAYAMQIPIIGINSGSLGCLTSLDINDYQNQLESILRTPLDQDCTECSVLAYKTDTEEGIAINELCFLTPTQAGIYTFASTHSQNPFITRSSGMILCTPLGSTGFALSAGGSAVERDLPVFEAVPVCPCAGIKHSAVFSENHVFSLQCDRKMTVSIDGDEFFSCNSEITVRKAPERLRIKKAKAISLPSF